MSVFDYRNSVEFTEYEYRLVRMFISEFCHGIEFEFIDEIDLDELKMYWYEDRSEDVLGGFYYLQRNRIYLNSLFADGCSRMTWIGRMNRVAMMFPTIVHEMCHYWQSRKLWIFYLFLQIPGIRDITIERQAYAVQDILYDNPRLLGGTVAAYAEMKKRHGFEDCYFDDVEKDALAAAPASGAGLDQDDA